MTTVVSGSYPAVNSDSDVTINGLTVGKGGGAIAGNTAVGYQAGYSNTTGTPITVFGYQAGYANTTGIWLTAFGYQALRNSTGDNNSAFGRALVTNTTGTSNSAFGMNSLYYNTTGSYNTAQGQESLFNNTTASHNTAVGYQAGYTNITGTQSTYLGSRAGYNATGNYNTIVGDYAGQGITTGTGNSFLGQGSGNLVTTGSNNTIIGRYDGNQSGLDMRTSSKSIVISDGDGLPQYVVGFAPNGPGSYSGTAGYTTIGAGGTSATLYNGVIGLNGNAATNRGSGIQGYMDGTQAYALGAYSFTVGGGSNGSFAVKNLTGGVFLSGTGATSWTAVSDETRKDIIEPITGGLAKVATLRTVIGKLKTDEEGTRRPYLIAQDVQKVLPEAVTEAEDREGKHLGLSYTEVIPLLVNAIQELNAKVIALEAQLGAK
jgi:hypothetical protein